MRPFLTRFTVTATENANKGRSPEERCPFSNRFVGCSEADFKEPHGMAPRGDAWGIGR